MGATLGKLLRAMTPAQYARYTPATQTQAELFLSEGFTYSQVERKVAVDMLELTLRIHHMETLNNESVDDLLVRWREEEDPWDWQEFEVEGIGRDAYFSLIEHYGVPNEGGGRGRQHCIGSWPVWHHPTTEKFKKEGRLLAEYCMPEDPSDASATPKSRGVQDDYNNHGREPMVDDATNCIDLVSQIVHSTTVILTLFAAEYVPTLNRLQVDTPRDADDTLVCEQSALFGV